MAARHSITCYFDVVSPYSYLGVLLLNKLKAGPWANVDVELKPFFLHGIMQGSGNKPPATVAAKGAYMLDDLITISNMAGLPFKFPSHFPLMTVGTMRLLLAVQKHASDKYVQCIEKLYDAYFLEDQNISDPEVLIAALAPILGGADKAQEMLKLSTDMEIKEALTNNTNEALKKGAFGAPTFFVEKAGSDEEMMFFGSDRFEVMASVLELPYPGINMASKL
ncbi:Glutathione S-transferase kappa 1 [Podila verticillata]|nr:Glutathione S-transferase kappa 1 [Podila verticillata]KAI9234510.1 MAG: thioredoxin-like protein [Podila humilis]